MSEATLAEVLREGMAAAARFNADHAQPVASVCVSLEGKAIDITLDGSRRVYGDWIPGEGADIALERDLDTQEVCGARLPFHAKTLVVAGSNFETIVIDLQTGEIKIGDPSAEESK